MTSVTDDHSHSLGWLLPVNIRQALEYIYVVGGASLPWWFEGLKEASCVAALFVPFFSLTIGVLVIAEKWRALRRHDPVSANEDFKVGP